MREIFNVLKVYIRSLVVGPIFKLIEAIIEVLLPLLIATVIDSLVQGDELVLTALKMVGLVILGLIFAVCAQYIAAKTSQSFGTDLRNKLFKHITNLSTLQIQKYGTSNITNRIMYDSTNLELAAAMFIRLVIRVPFICIASLVMTFIIDKKIATILLISIVIFTIIVLIIIKRSSNLLKKAQISLDKIVLKVKESLTNIRLIRSFVAQSKEIDKFEKLNEQRNKLIMKTNVVSSYLNPITTFILNITIIIILYYGNIQINTNNLTGGELIAIINYITQILASIIIFSNLITIYTRAYTSAQRIGEIFEEKTHENKGQIKEFVDTDIAIELKNVEFKYNTKKFIDKLNYQIKKGDVVGIVGMTGSGKSTILNLINGTYHVTSGKIQIFGKNILDYDEKFVKENIIFISQNIMLLNDTIESNILLGRKKEDRLDEALKYSEASEFVEKLDGKYNYLINDGGSNLSGGQKQRIALARAFIGKGKILLIDCATNSLDNITEKKVINNIINFSKENNITTIITSHKMDNLDKADLILEINNGRLKKIK